ncbi:hypothetical protein [Rhizobacter fulvus]
MSNDEQIAQAAIAETKSSSWGWLLPSVATLVIVKLFGLVGGLVTFGMYYVLKPKIGAWGGAAVAAVLGVVAALSFVAMMR